MRYLLIFLFSFLASVGYVKLLEDDSVTTKFQEKYLRWVSEVRGFVK